MKRVWVGGCAVSDLVVCRSIVLLTYLFIGMDGPGPLKCKYKNTKRSLARVSVRLLQGFSVSRSEESRTGFNFVIYQSAWR
ncbi:hypothetical protein C8R46DRAFT_56211 [Mycena filopes]|nr:hypothetical protein C8R46DRAFT_56211 [Mycena filopes]